VAIVETVAAGRNPVPHTRDTVQEVVVEVPEDSPSAAVASYRGVSPFASTFIVVALGPGLGMARSLEPMAAASSRPWAASEEHSQVAVEGSPCLVAVEGRSPEAVAFAMVGSP